MTTFLYVYDDYTEDAMTFGDDAMGRAEAFNFAKEIVEVFHLRAQRDIVRVVRVTVGATVSEGTTLWRWTRKHGRSRDVHVGFVPLDTTEMEVRQLLSTVGRLHDATFTYCGSTGALLECDAKYVEYGAAEKAINTLNGKGFTIRFAE